MIEKYAKNIGIIVAALSGTGAMMTAIGYLAERSHLAMLGFTNIPVDLNQYLYSGIRFIAFLPTLIILIAADILWTAKYTILVLVLIGLLAAIIWRKQKNISFFGNLKSRLQKLLGFLNKGVARFQAVSILIFIFIQFLGMFALFKAASLQNLLYTAPIQRLETSPIYFAPVRKDKIDKWALNGKAPGFDQVMAHVAEIDSILHGKKGLPETETPIYFSTLNADSLEQWRDESEYIEWSRLQVSLDQLQNLILKKNEKAKPDTSAFFSFPNTRTLKSWIYEKNENNESELNYYYFKLCSILLVTVLVLWYLLSCIKKYGSGKLSRPATIILVISLLLLATELLFVPINFGALLLSKSYQEVDVQFTKDEASANLTANPSPENRPPVVANPLRDQNMYTERFDHNLDASPPVFTDPDGDRLSYVASSSDSAVVTAVVQNKRLNKRLLVVRINDFEKNTEKRAVITITACDNRDGEVSNSFNITVKENSDDPEVERKREKEFTELFKELATTFTIGDPPFIIDLNRYFKKKGKRVTYTAWSADKSRATTAVMTGGYLVITPISSGSTSIELRVNVGTGWVTKSKQRVEIKPYILLYQTNSELYLYSAQSKRIRLVPRQKIGSITYLGLSPIFKQKNENSQQ